MLKIVNLKKGTRNKELEIRNLKKGTKIKI